GGAAVWLEWGAVLARYVVLGWLCAWVLRSEARFRHPRPGGSRAAALVLVVAAPVILAFSAPPTGSQTTPESGACGPSRGTVTVGSLPQTPADRPVGDGWFFSEASQQRGMGYTIVDDDQAQMYSEFTRLGGWQVLGFPASQRFTWHGALTQVTQRAILQW